MKANGVLVIHTVVFLSFVAAALSSPFVAVFDPAFFSWSHLLVIAILAVAVVSTWPLLGGCPFTIWENTLRRSESPSSAYTDPCIDHYVYRWFGIMLPPKLSTYVLYTLFLLPVISGLSVHL